MTSIWTITKKELRHYFNSPIAYVILFIYLAISGYFFAYNLFLYGVVSMRSYLQTIPLILLFFVPALSMRLLAEERKTGTLEHLVTLPVSDIEILLGKFLGALSFYVVMVGITFIYPVALSTLGKLDWGPVIGGYIGLVFLGACIIGIGLFASSLTSNQIVAFIVAFAIGFVLYLVGQSTQYIPAVAGLVDFLGFTSHFNNISTGIIDSRDVLYYLSLITLMLFLTLQSLLNRKK